MVKFNSNDSISAEKNVRFTQPLQPNIKGTENGTARFDMIEALKKLCGTEDVDLSDVKITINRNVSIMNAGGIDLEDMIPLDSDLGKKITARMDQLSDRRINGGPYIMNEKPNEYDNYVPIYEVNMDSPWCDKKIIGYRHKTPQEMSGNKMYQSQNFIKPSDD